MSHASRARPLRIGIDATCVGSGRGYGRFVRELLPPLLREDPRNEYVLFADVHTGPELESLPARCVRPRTSQAMGEAANARGRRALGDMWRMGRAVADEELDIMYFPSVYTYYPVPGRVPVAVAIHDTIPEHYGDVVFPTRVNRLLWDAKVFLARRRARALITVSEWSRQSLADFFGLAIEDIYVTEEAPGPLFRPVIDAAPRRAWLASRGLPEGAEYFLFVGGFNPHKNLKSLVQAFARSLAAAPDKPLYLLLVGDYERDVFHIDVGGLRAAIHANGVGERVRLVGFVPDEELRHLYAGALGLVIPSFEEGFGLPAVEAAACGTPCIATRNSPLPQLLEDGGIFVDPADGAALEHALVVFARDDERRKEFARSALERAGKLTWSNTAEATRRALEEISRGRA